MHASASTSWYLAPARPFPAKVWLEWRFPFRIPTPLSAQPEARPDEPAMSPRRPFPAKVWLEQRRGHL